MNEAFEKICKLSQKQLKNYVVKRLSKKYDNVISEDGYVYAQGTFPVLLVAHLDTVHENAPNPILYDVENDTYSSPNGIGGDDRCGVFMILEIMQRYNCSILFCEDEEIGGVGARKFIKSDLAKDLTFNYIIEFDRRGYNDAVFYDCENDEFETFITQNFYKTAYGSFSDISVIAPFLGCAAVNLSCGYYAAHTKEEYVVYPEMMRSIKEACGILERTTEEDVFEYVESTYSKYYKNYGYYGSGGYYSGSSFGYYGGEDGADIYYYIVEYTGEDNTVQWFDTYASSEAEAVGRLLMYHPTLCYNNVIDVLVDKSVF
jgi:hypothetical protein